MALHDTASPPTDTPEIEIYFDLGLIKPPPPPRGFDSWLDAIKDRALKCLSAEDDIDAVSDAMDAILADPQNPYTILIGQELVVLACAARLELESVAMIETMYAARNPHAPHSRELLRRIARRGNGDEINVD